MTVDDRDWQTEHTPMGWTLAQDGAQSSIELTEPVMEQFAAVLDDEDATDDALYKASVLHLPPRAPRITRDCEHPDQPHQHGTRVAYVHDRCRCDPCTTANRDGMKTRSRRKAQARWNPDTYDLVAGDIVRAHLRTLMDAGMGWKRIAAAAGIGSSTVYPILYGKHVNDPLHPEHRPPRKQVRRHVADALLGVQLQLADGAPIDGTGTRRRLQALVAVGWSQSRLARMLGWETGNLNSLILGRPGNQNVSKATADTVAALYEQHWSAPPVPASRFEQAGITHARRVALERGWPPPMQWDDDTIDDPTRWAQWNQTAVTTARIARVEQMLRVGHPRARIVRRIGVGGPVDVRRMLARAGRDDLVARWDATRNERFVRATQRKADAA